MADYTIPTYVVAKVKIIVLHDNPIHKTMIHPQHKCFSSSMYSRFSELKQKIDHETYELVKMITLYSIIQKGNQPVHR